MTESEWLACTDPGPMLEFLRGKATPRKLRLLACAIALRLWGDSIAEHARHAIAAVERAADGGGPVEASRGVLVEVKSPTPGRFYDRPRPHAPPFVTVGSVVSPETVVCLVEALKLFNEITADCFGVIAEVTTEDAAVVEWGATLFRVIPVPAPVGARGRLDASADLLRDVFGPLPFRPVTIPHDVLAWSDRVVARLAAGIYEDNAFGRMPILADALMDAGCDDDEILAHCRAGMGHVRGCWVVDLCLGRSWERALGDDHPPFGHYPPRPDAVRVVLSGGRLSGFEVGVMPPLPPVIRVNAPRHGNHRVWITCTYALRGGQYEHVKTENVSVATVC
jgi:biotin carboxyl carrier protein